MEDLELQDGQQQLRWWVRVVLRILRIPAYVWIAGGSVLILLALILVGYHYKITLWDWAQLLIVPAILAGGGLWFNTQQREREQRIADNRAQDDSLQAYLDGMSQLLTDKDRPLHRAQLGDSLSTVARARTLTVLSRLDGDRKRSVLQFLYESHLIERRHNIVSLQQADLSGTNLSEAFLDEANLYKADLSRANLEGAILSGAILSGAILRDANLSKANLSTANLEEAILSRANLSMAYLRGANAGWAILQGANLREAILQEANLRETNLTEADLSYANLRDANLEVTNLVSGGQPPERGQPARRHHAQRPEV